MSTKSKKMKKMKKDGTPWLSNTEWKALQKTKKAPQVTQVPQGQVGKKKKVQTYIKEDVQSIAQNAQTVIPISATFDSNAVTYMWLSLFSKAFEKAWNISSVVPPYGLSYLQDAYIQLQQVTSQYMVGETPMIKELPYWIQVVMNLMAPKNVNFRLNQLKYSWAQNFTPSTIPTFTVYPAGVSYQWCFGYPDPLTEGQYNQVIIPMNVSGTDPSNLQLIFGLITNDHPDTKLKPTGSVKQGQADASAFARTYAYLGDGNGPAGEVYGECEMETNIVKSWIPAQFCVFENTDTRVSRSFRPKSCDSCFFSSYPLINGLTSSDFRNPGPVVIKFIDFEEIYEWYVTWLTAAWTQALSLSSTNVVNGILNNPLPFSAQTFRILLRQALLQCFTDQAMFQFMAPKPQNGNSDNVFVPFLISGGSYSASIFGGMKFPLLLAENIKMLKTKILKVAGSKTKVIHVPVLGYWWDDTWDTDPTLTAPLIFPDEGMKKLLPPLTESSIFGIAPGIENEIDLVDGFNQAVSPPSPVNLNSSYYQTAMNTLNQLLSLLTSTGGELSAVSGDGGPGLSLLNFTRYIQTVPLSRRAAQMRRGELVKEHVERLGAMMKARTVRGKSAGPKENLKDVKEIIREGDYNYVKASGGIEVKSGAVNPSGGVDVDVTISISSNMVMSQDMQALLKELIIPCIRPDPTDSSYPQIVSEWQIAYVEPNIAQYNTGGDTSIASTFRVDDIDEAATSVITSITNGQNSSDIMSALKELVKSGEGPDWLALLGGVVGAGLQIGKAVGVF